MAKRIAVTTGDPAGIGPEVVVKALSSPQLPQCIPIVVGDLSVVQEALQRFACPLTLRIINTAEDASFSPEVLWLMDGKVLTTFHKNGPDARNGTASARYIAKAAELGLERTVDAVVTAPVSKEALKRAGLPWPGHTEMLAELTSTREYAMMLIGGPLRVILVTIHTALRNVPDLITKEKVLQTILLAKKACGMLGIEKPQIGVAGLNPHAGESGVFGNEEERAIQPAIAEAGARGIIAEGPFPPDIVFHKAYQGDLDIVVCMYHDQGLIPLKMIAFDKGVNVTVGIPFIRTSPDHGTAYDISWQGIADPSSMVEAIKLAIRLRI